MNIKQFKRRWINHYIEPELFYLPIRDKKPIKYGTLYIGGRIPYYDVDAEAFDESWAYYAWWNTSIVVKDSSDKIVYLSAKGRIAQLHTIQSIPYGTYKAKVIMAQYGGVVLDNEWHEFILDDTTNKVYQFINLYYNVYKCVMFPDRKPLTVKTVEKIPYTDNTAVVNVLTRATSTPKISSLYSYSLYENNRLIQTFKYTPPFSVSQHMAVSVDSFTLGYIPWVTNVSSVRIEYDRSLGLNRPYSTHVIWETELSNDFISGYDVVDEGIGIYDPYADGYDYMNDRAQIGYLYISTNTLSNLPTSSTGFPIWNSTISVSEGDSCSGYNGQCTDISIVNFLGYDYGIYRSTYEQTGLATNRYNYANNDIRPAIWLSYFATIDDILKKTELTSDDVQALVNCKHPLSVRIWMRTALGGTSSIILEDIFDYSVTSDDKDNLKLIEEIINPNVPDFRDTLYYGNLLKAVEKGSLKTNYYGWSSFYWIHNGQVRQINNGQCNIIRNSDDVFQPYSTVEQYVMAGPPVYSDDYDVYY